jgi:hypothetical protein
MEETLNLKDHWNRVYQRTEATSLGWYEENCSNSLDLISETGLSTSSRVFHAGGGATRLINDLLLLGFENMIVNDLAPSALSVLKESLPEEYRHAVKFVVDDLTCPSELLHLTEVDLWHDRAVLHFFTGEEQRKSYVHLLKKMVRKGGFVILAEFNKKGARKCSGLDVCNYDVEMYNSLLGSDFQLIKSFDFVYTQPSGDPRPFVYALFKRIEKEA